MKSLPIIIGLVATAVLSSGCAHQIPPASVGIKFDGGSGISEHILTPKVVFVGPYQRLIIYPTAINQATYVKNAKEGETEGDNSVKATTSEGATLPIDITVAYHVQPNDAVRAYERFGTENLEQIQSDYIRWHTVYAVDVVAGNRSIFDLISKERANLGTKIQALLAPKLARLGITVDNVYVGEVHPSKEINEKISESIGIRNELEKEKIDLRRATVEARTTITNAERMAVQNRLMANQGEKAVALKRLQLRKLAAEKWDGVAPIISDGAIPFANGVKPQ